MNLHIGPDGIEICHYFESCKLKAYPDPASPRARFGSGSGSPWTIGWGDTGPDVVEGLEITQSDADERFARRMAHEFEPAVQREVRFKLSQKQFDALVSIFYNTGVGNMSRSTLVRVLNFGDYEGAAAEFSRWVRAGGRVMKGLQRRREAERLVFLGSDATPAIQAALAKFP